MTFEHIINLALWAYPPQVRHAHGTEMRDTALEASDGSRAKLLRESLTLVSTGMRARASAAASLVLGTRADGTLNLGAVASCVARTYVGAWRSLLSASALYLVTDTVFSWSLANAPTATPTVSAILQFVALIVRLVVLASFAAFVISRSVGIEEEGSNGVRAALSGARSTAGELTLILFVGLISLAVVANLAKLAVLVVLGVAFGVSPNLSGVTGGGIAGAGVVGAVPFVTLLTMWSVALPVVVIERPGGMRSLARSRELVHGNGLHTLVAVTIVIVVIAAASLLSSLLTGAAGEIGAAIVWWPVAPIPMLAATALYLKLGERPPTMAVPFQPGQD